MLPCEHGERDVDFGALLVGSTPGWVTNRNISSQRQLNRLASRSASGCCNRTFSLQREELNHEEHEGHEGRKGTKGREEGMRLVRLLS